MYALLDILFVVLHSALVVFNLLGWIWKRTRRVHLGTILLTLLSWGVLGIFYGLGYCPCTDWHWDIKRKLGETDLPSSYIKYYLDAITPFDWDPAVVDTLVLTTTLAALVASAWVNWRDWRKKKSG